MSRDAIVGAHLQERRGAPAGQRTTSCRATGEITHCTQDGARGGAMCMVVVNHGGRCCAYCYSLCGGGVVPGAS